MIFRGEVEITCRNFIEAVERSNAMSQYGDLRRVRNLLRLFEPAQQPKPAPFPAQRVHSFAEPANSDLKKIGWKGEMSREEAEAALSRREYGYFLTRWSTAQGCFVISLRDKTTILHVRGNILLKNKG